MGGAVEQVFDLELEGIVFMHENALDQGFLLVAQLATAEAMLGGALSVDADILIGVIEQHIFFALRDRQRAGGPRRYGHDERLAVFRTACSPPPEGETHWTVRALAAAVGIGKSQTHAILAEADLKPHQVRSWLQSIDPEFETKQAEVCGLYLDPPEGTIVVSIDEKTSVQAKEPIRTELTLEPGRPARREFEYRRHGTVALLAALLVHTGEVKGQVYERNSRLEFLDFLELLEAEIPAGKQVHAILDNLQVHKTPEVVAWLETHPRWQFHFTPTHASWLNQIELFVRHEAP